MNDLALVVRAPLLKDSIGVLYHLELCHHSIPACATSEHYRALQGGRLANKKSSEFVMQQQKSERSNKKKQQQRKKQSTKKQAT